VHGVEQPQLTLSALITLSCMSHGPRYGRSAVGPDRVLGVLGQDLHGSAFLWYWLGACVGAHA